MPTLIIAEKPSVARGIADAVGAHERRDGYIEGGGYLISWCRGHIIDLDFPRTTRSGPATGRCRSCP